MGATWPRDLPITNRQLDGIHFAMAFLETWQKKQMGNNIDVAALHAKEKDVIVIGGGDTGCDCIGTSLRQVREYFLGSHLYGSFTVVVTPCPGIPLGP